MTKIAHQVYKLLKILFNEQFTSPLNMKISSFEETLLFKLEIFQHWAFNKNRHKIKTHVFHIRIKTT